MHDSLLYAQIGLARVTDSNLPSVSTDRAMLKGLLTLHGAACDITPQELHTEKYKLVPDCLHCAAPCGRTSDPTASELGAAPDNIKQKKAQILQT